MFFVIKKKKREVVAFAYSYMTKEKKLITIFIIQVKDNDTQTVDKLTHKISRMFFFSLSLYNIIDILYYISQTILLDIIMT